MSDSAQLTSQLTRLADAHSFACLGGSRAGPLRLKLEADSIQVAVQWPAAAVQQPLERELSSLFAAAGHSADLALSWQVPPAPVPPLAASGQQVRNLLVVSSAKGGVGKSSLAVNLALALSEGGAAVGLLDADIYGPNVPRLLGLKANAAPKVTGEKAAPVFHPVRCGELSVLSMAMLAAAGSAMIWRGPMVSGAVKQLLLRANWGELDYLIVDMPPGTGDIQLTLAQAVPVSGAILITTPDPMAREDTGRGCAMFRKLKMPLLGLVENMAWWQCTQCAHKHDIFSHSQAAVPDLLSDLPLLHRLPLMPPTPDGRALLLAEPDSDYAHHWRQTAWKIAVALADYNNSSGSLRPKIVKIRDE